MRVLKQYPIEKALFFDIETVSGEKELPLEGDLTMSWSLKVNKTEELNLDKSIFELYKEKAPLYPEFNKIVCISMGRYKEGKLVTKSYVGEEKNIIEEFYSDLSRFPGHFLVGHSVENFDCPVVAKRGVINGISPHSYVDFSGMKPWELNHIVDIAKIWRGSSWHGASLISMAVAFGIKHSKKDLKGDEVYSMYYSEDPERFNKIKVYCEEDVRVTAELFVKMKN